MMTHTHTRAAKTTRSLLLPALLACLQGKAHKNHTDTHITNKQIIHSYTYISPTKKKEEKENAQY